MARLPQQFAPLVYGIIQAAITTAVSTAIATLQLTDFNMRFVVGTREIKGLKPRPASGE
jgi:hypothetical protein